MKKEKVTKKELVNIKANAKKATIKGVKIKTN